MSPLLRVPFPPKYLNAWFHELAHELAVLVPLRTLQYGSLIPVDEGQAGDEGIHAVEAGLKGLIREDR